MNGGQKRVHQDFTLSGYLYWYYMKQLTLYITALHYDRTNDTDTSRRNRVFGYRTYKIFPSKVYIHFYQNGVTLVELTRPDRDGGVVSFRRPPK